jgi:hypothetical protein
MLFYGSTDGSTFIAFSNVIDVTNYSLVTRITSSATGNHIFILPSIAGLQAVEIASLSWTSGTANITIAETEGFATNFLVNNVTLNGFPTAAALNDSTANPTLTQIQNFPMVWNGSTWQRLATSGNLGVSLMGIDASTGIATNLTGLTVGGAVAGEALLVSFLGGQGQFLAQETGTPYELQVVQHVGSTGIDPRQIRSLNSTDTVTVGNFPTDARGNINVVTNQFSQIPKTGWGVGLGWGNFGGW